MINIRLFRERLSGEICISSIKVMLHGTIRNDDFCRNTALQCWNNLVFERKLQQCVALKIVVANRLV